MNEDSKETAIKIAVEEWQHILYKMNYYGFDSGWVAHDLSGELAYFVNEPSFGGVYITKEDVLNYISQY